jgi:hypothetical protein
MNMYMKAGGSQSRSERKENIAHIQRKKKFPLPDGKRYEKEIRTYFERRLRNFKSYQDNKNAIRTDFRLD